MLPLAVALRLARTWPGRAPLRAASPVKADPVASARGCRAPAAAAQRALESRSWAEQSLAVVAGGIGHGGLLRNSMARAARQTRSRRPVVSREPGRIIRRAADPTTRAYEAQAITGSWRRSNSSAVTSQYVTDVLGLQIGLEALMPGPLPGRPRRRIRYQRDAGLADRPAPKRAAQTGSVDAPFSRRSFFACARLRARRIFRC